MESSSICLSVRREHRKEEEICKIVPNQHLILFRHNVYKYLYGIKFIQLCQIQRLPARLQFTWFYRLQNKL